MKYYVEFNQQGKVVAIHSSLPENALSTIEITAEQLPVFQQLLGK